MTGWRPVRSLLTAIFLAMAGSGFLATLIALRLQEAGASPVTIGWMGTAYFIGLGLGSLLAFTLIGRVGHIRAFATFVSLFSASMLTYALYQHPIFWAGLRLLDGLCMAGTFVCLESWLNDRTPATGRGGVLATYMIALYVGQAVGQPILMLATSQPLLPLVAGSLLMSLAVLPIALTRMSAPPVPEGGAMGLGALYAASPLGVAGALATGVMLGAFYALGGLFTAGIGMDLSQTSRFMGIAILGGVVLQWPLGLLSDRFDRRRVIIGTLGAAMALALLIILAALALPALLLPVIGLFGGVAFALYPLFVAHANDRLSDGARVGATGGLVLVYAGGAILGPLSGAVTMAALGPTGLFALIALVAAATLAFALLRTRRTAPVPAEQQMPYQILPRTTPAAAMVLDRPPDAG
ncbi:MFS transporter [Niveispirillum sp. SYP-B3756]|uniref:MFS transporter n=1 Tax=Niveispirillum sp. SYP-B3756 TaxID=2662178 RepID=UPI0012914E0D|nr:MFS transporter [Niveispirillum sp. SYP-B3756]MQP67392.1 MFS transporter [Niveispirillum sp. SYP-B3756]